MVESKQDKEKDGPWWRPGLLLFAELSGWIVVPVLIAVYLGRWLDQRYDSEPWLYLTSVGLAFIISIVGIVRGATKAIQQMEKENQKNKNLNNKKDDQ